MQNAVCKFSYFHFRCNFSQLVFNGQSFIPLQTSDSSIKTYFEDKYKADFHPKNAVLEINFISW